MNEETILWRGKPSFVFVVKRISYFGLTLAVSFFILRKVMKMFTSGLNLPREISYIMDYIRLFDVVLMIGIGAGIILFVSSTVFAIIKRSSSTYIITEREIIINDKPVSILAGQNAQIKRTFLDNVFGTGDLIIGNYKMESISHPEVVYEILQNASQRSIE